MNDRKQWDFYTLLPLRRWNYNTSIAKGKIDPESKTATEKYSKSQPQVGIICHVPQLSTLISIQIAFLHLDLII